MALTLAREIAYDVYAAVIRQNKKPEELIDLAYENAGKKLKRLDRAFIKEVLYGSLRWHSKLLWILQNTSHRDLDKASGEIIAALVCGTYQIYYMDRVPDRASVNESVEYIRKKGQESACTFVNGILRQIAKRAQYFAKPDKIKAPNEYLALQFAHPRWIVDRWSHHFKFDRLSQLLAQNNLAPPITVRCNLLKTPLEKTYELQEQLLRDENLHSDRRHLREAFHLKTFPNIGRGSFFAEGLITFQDEASQLVGRLVAPEPAMVIIDLCAGPGGKLSHIFELGGGDLDLIAVEKDQRQLTRAQQTLIRLGHTSSRILWQHIDAMALALPVEGLSATKADKILLDAPCSGLGVLRRHPEGKWQKTANAIFELSALQRKMILHALSLLKVGGELIYSVCSFEPEESIQHLEFLVKSYGDKIEVESPGPRVPDAYRRYLTRGDKPMLQIYSGNPHDMDGFSAFIVKLKSDEALNRHDEE